MSRHRNVRNLDYDELLDDEAAADSMTPEESDKLDAAVEQITQTLGSSFSLQEVKDAAWYYYFDVEKSTNYLLDQQTKREEKVKKAQAPQTTGISSAQSLPNAQKAFSNPSPDDKVQKAQAASKGLSKEILATEKSKGPESDATQNTGHRISKAANKARTGRLASADARQYASFVVVGHVDAGKSTLFGRLLYDLGNIEERSMQKLRTESGKIQKSSFAFAWAMDSSVEERERGVTIDIATNTFDVDKTTFTILDAPGHKDFVPNMIAGASQADFAVLVVDSSRGAFESGFDAAGQTKEHAILIRSLGIQSVIVAVNKLDNVQWSQERFKDIRVQLSIFLTHSGFEASALSFVPCSGLTGANVATQMREACAKWYTGKSLVQEMSSMPISVRDESGPFRMIISDIQASPNSSNITVIGRISTGELQVSDTVVCMPSNERAVLKSLISGQNTDQAFAGDNVTLTLSEIDPVHLRVGDVLCHTTELVHNTNNFEAQMVTFQLNRPLLSGSSVVLHRGRADVAAVIKTIQIVDKVKGGFKPSRHVLGGGQARMTIELANGSLPLEVFFDNKDLGRIILRREGETVAAGIVIALL